MTKDDIIRMANEVGIIGPASARQGFKMYANPGRLKRFAALVAAAEREKVAAWMMQQGYATGHGDTVEELLQELDWQIREQERELIARSMDKQVDLACDYLDRKWAQEMAAAIRARGEQ